MHRNLYPLKKPVKKVSFSVCDIEAKDWNQFLVIGWCNENNFLSFLSLDDFFKHIFSSDETICYAHFGGIYDFLFLLNFVLGSTDYRLDSMIPRGSGLLCIVVTDGTRKVTFRDSSALLPYSLEKLTKSFGVKHIKKEFDVENITAVTPELIEYLKHDCIGLYECLKKYEENELVKKVGLKITRSSQALNVFRTYLKKSLPACPQGVDEFVRNAYAGGRTEIYRPLYKNEEKPIYGYDINSLYPSVLHDFDMPWGFKCFSNKVDLEQIGFGFFEVEVPEDTYMPILWTRESGKFIFPVGRFSGIFPLCEVRRSVENGARIVRSKGIAYFENGGKFFQEYVATLYEKRRTSSDPVERIIIKDLLNHLYGRMGLRLTREQLEFDEGQTDVKPFLDLLVGEKYYRIVKKDVSIQSFSNVAIAAWTTAQARLRLFDTVLKPTEHSIYYTDTDSGYTPDLLPTGDGLGKLKLESTSKDACFLLPKTYIVGNKIAFKGFENRKVQHFKVDDFTAALDGDLRLFKIEMEARGLNKFRTALRKGDLLSKKGLTTKSIKSRYDKRIVYRDKRGNWETRPIVLGKSNKG